jgi:ketopantoate hydroxymethyltransferase
MGEAFANFIEEVEQKKFPGDEHSVTMKDEQWNALLKELGE